MKRDLYNKLMVWKKNNNRKPIILKGARQVGKTYLIKEFGKNEYKNIVYFNFEEDQNLSFFFEKKINPTRIIEQLSIYSETKIEKDNTLIFFDEIQQCPRALTSLKYFCELSDTYHIISAGSLLGVKLGHKSQFPVGKVEFMDLYPFSFMEFLSGIGKHKLRQIIDDKVDFNSINQSFHNELIYFLKIYFYVGGMPEAIFQYTKNGNFLDIRVIQNNILTAYLNDFSKHTSKSEAIRITETWNSLPNQLAKENKKFKYSEISQNARSRDYYESIQWLINAGLVYKSISIKVPKLPLSGYISDNAFKLYVLDVGLLSALLNLPQKVIALPDKIFSEYNGVFTENFVAQELITGNIFKNVYKKDLYYWSNESSAEVDFIFNYNNLVFPLEVKAGISKRKTSLKIYGEKYSPKMLLRTNILNFKKQDYICNYPLYSISKIHEII